jgi:hypothetical protein
VLVVPPDEGDDDMTMCVCGHALSQHPDRGACDYDGHACTCKGYAKTLTRNLFLPEEKIHNGARYQPLSLVQLAKIADRALAGHDMDADAIMSGLEKIDGVWCQYVGPAS